MTEVEASLECYLAVVYGCWKRAVLWPWLSDQKENLIGLMKEDTIKTDNRNTDTASLQCIGGSYMFTLCESHL